MNICPVCNTIHSNPKYCSLSCATRAKNNNERYLRIQKYNKTPSQCLECYIILEYDKRGNKFCSQTCSGKYSNRKRTESGWQQSEETKKKQSIWAKENPRGIITKSSEERKKGIMKNCSNKKCKSLFYSTPLSKKKYCSNSCAAKDGQCGGYRHKSQLKTKKSIYKGYYMDSGAELYFAKSLDKIGVKWIKNDISWKKFYFYFKNNKRRKYYPDFYLPQMDLWVEVKGKRYTNDLELKLASVPKIKLVMNYEISNFIKDLEESG